MGKSMVSLYGQIDDFSTPIRMHPESGCIRGRLTQDLLISCLQGGLNPSCFVSRDRKEPGRARERLVIYWLFGNIISNRKAFV
jgi:hypothetical protein